MSNRVRKQQPSLRMTVAQKAQEAAREAERERTRKQRIYVGIGGSIAVVLLVVGIVAFALTRPKEEAAPEANPLAQELGCVSCHTSDGSRAEGPTWKGLYGSPVTLTDGTTVTADDAYLRQAILDPQSQVAAGYPTAMPKVEVSEAQADALVAYIKTLAD